MRIYSKKQAGGGTDVIERERPRVVRESVHETRDATAERNEMRSDIDLRKWVNPSNLDAPDPRPGFVQKWVEDDSGGKNWRKRMLEGWSPRDPSTISHHQAVAFVTAKTGAADNFIRVGNLVLCEMPKHIAKQRYDAISELVKRQGNAMPDSIQDLRAKQGFKARVDLTNDEQVFRGRKPADLLD